MREGSLTYFMLIIARILFWRNEGHRHPNKVWSQSQAECIRGIRIGNLSILKLTYYLSHCASRVCFKCSQQLIDKLSEKIYCHLFWRSFIGVGFNSIPYLEPDSAAPKCILVPFERYRHSQKCAQKSSCNTFSIYISWKLKTKIFSRDSNILPQMHWKSNSFGHSTTIIGGFWVSLNYPILNFKKMVFPKNVWMRHCLRCGVVKTNLQICYATKKYTAMKKVQIRSFFWSLFSSV